MPPLRTTPLFAGRIFRLDRDRVRFPDGSEGDFDIIRHPGASAVVPFLDDPRSADPRVLLIHQYRYATGGDLWEIPAGRRDGDEDPAATAHRELAEETGYRAGRMERLASLYTTPGFTDELIHLYLATELVPGESAREADEFLDLHELRWSAVGRMLRDGVIADAKTAAALMWVQCWVSGAVGRVGA